MAEQDSTAQLSFHLGKMLMDPSYQPDGGRLQVPGGYVNTLLYGQEGLASLTLNGSTKSVIAFYDPESAVRTGQNAIHVVERDGSLNALVQTKIPVGTPSTDFLTVGVYNSSLACRNTSGEDLVAGTQTAGVIFSPPRDLSKLTANTLQNIVIDKDRDLLTNLASKLDSTYSICPTNHLGKKMGLSRADAASNRVAITRTYSTKASSSNYDVGGFKLTNTTLNSLNSGDTTVYTTDYLFRSEKSAIDVLTFASYEAAVDYDIDISFTQNTSVSTDFVRLTYVVQAEDYAGNVLDQIQLSTINQNLADDTGGPPQSANLKLLGSVRVQGDAPIARVVIAGLRAENSVSAVPEDFSATNITLQFESGEVTISAIEQTADVPLRPIHVCVFEGVNTSATLTFHGGAGISGVPSSENAFLVAPTKSIDDADQFRVEAYLKSVSDSMPHVQTVSGKVLSMAMYDTLEKSDLPVALAAFDFKSLKKGFKKMKKVAKTIKAVADKAGMTPMLEEAVDAGIGMVPGGRLGQAGARAAYRAALE